MSNAGAFHIGIRVAARLPHSSPDGAAASKTPANEGRSCKSSGPNEHDQARRHCRGGLGERWGASTTYALKSAGHDGGQGFCHDVDADVGQGANTMSAATPRVRSRPERGALGLHCISMGPSRSITPTGVETLSLGAPIASASMPSFLQGVAKTTLCVGRLACCEVRQMRGTFTHEDGHQRKNRSANGWTAMLGGEVDENVERRDLEESGRVWKGLLANRVVAYLRNMSSRGRRLAHLIDRLVMFCQVRGSIAAQGVVLP